jgi:hypothetical protein
MLVLMRGTISEQGLLKKTGFPKRRKSMQIQHETLERKVKIDLSQLWWVGLLLIVTTVVINFLLCCAVLVLFPTTKVELDPIIFYTGLGTLGSVLVFALLVWLAPYPIDLYRMVAGVVLVLSFIPDIVLLTRGGSAMLVGAYMLMHIVTAVICVAGLTRFVQAKEGF